MTLLFLQHIGFPDSSPGKESACNAADPGLIPGSGRSAREGIGYPLQCSWASVMAQLIKNPPAKQETPKRDPGPITRLARSPEEGIGYPLQYSWASLVAQLVRNLPIMLGDLGLIPGLGRYPREGKGYHSSILAWRIPLTV